MRLRLSIVLIAFLGLLSTATAQAGTKTDKTDWDEGSEKELPPLELHGYFRLRGDLFHNYALGYTDKVGYQFGKLTSFFTPFSERNPNLDLSGLETSKQTSSRNLATGLDSVVASRSSIRLSPICKKATRTPSDSTTSVPVRSRPSAPLQTLSASRRSFTAIPR